MDALVSTLPPLIRRRVRVRGQVQGVGFRPFVYRLAAELGIAGWVRNDAQGIEIEAQGRADAIDALIARLRRDAPPLARVGTIESQNATVVRAESDFAIVTSIAGRVTTSATPDAAVCTACLAELLDPGDRRHRYPFVNCTHCGPRYTITRALPYDRPQTSMAGFAQCDACRREYEDPRDRRFHAQPNACPRCGPALWLCDGHGRRLPVADVVAETSQRLARGEVVALKGLGGFHLACNARNARTVATLRRRKNREEKPFAVMFANTASMREFACIDHPERRLLESAERPIVLLAKRAGCDETLAGVAPGLAWLGAMLPYTPLHWLLFHEAAGRPRDTGWLRTAQPLALVMTSANPGGEPIVRDNDEALRRLAGIADAFVLHDRGIVTRCDDSVVRVERWRRQAPGNAPVAASPREAKGFRSAAGSAHATRFIRRARGYTPLPVRLPASGPSVLAVGGHLNNTLCLTRGDEAFLSQHIGDLDNAPTCEMLEETAARLADLLEIRPGIVAHDLHPDFFSTRWAAAYAGERGIESLPVQHHHAHIAAVAAENRVRGPLLGLALDGVGLGEDRGIWGGELLRVDGAACERLGHLAPIALPGGDRAAREPWRMAAAALHRLGRADEIAARFPDRAGGAVAQLLQRGVRCPPTSSMGRWFDAAAGLLGVRETTAFEGQAAMLLEGLAARHGHVEPMPGGFRLETGVLDFSPLLAALADLVPAAPRAPKRSPESASGSAGIDRTFARAAPAAAMFHATVAEGLARWVADAAAVGGLRRVVLGGGCFMNQVLTTALRERLRQAGFEVLEARRAPPGDGGLALGQAWIAIASTRMATS